MQVLLALLGRLSLPITPVAPHTQNPILCQHEVLRVTNKPAATVPNNYYDLPKRHASVKLSV